MPESSERRGTGDAGPGRWTEEDEGERGRTRIHPDAVTAWPRSGPSATGQVHPAPAMGDAHGLPAHWRAQLSSPSHRTFHAGVTGSACDVSVAYLGRRRRGAVTGESVTAVWMPRRSCLGRAEYAGVTHHLARQAVVAVPPASIVVLFQLCAAAGQATWCSPRPRCTTVSDRCEAVDGEGRQAAPPLTPSVA